MCIQKRVALMCEHVYVSVCKEKQSRLSGISRDSMGPVRRSASLIQIHLGASPDNPNPSWCQSRMDLPVKQHFSKHKFWVNINLFFHDNMHVFHVTFRRVSSALLIDSIRPCKNCFEKNVCFRVIPQTWPNGNQFFLPVGGSRQVQHGFDNENIRERYSKRFISQNMIHSVWHFNGFWMSRGSSRIVTDLSDKQLF